MNNPISEWKQLKEKIRTSAEYLIVAVDIGKRKNLAWLKSSQGEIYRRKLRFANNLKGYNRLLKEIESLLLDKGLQAVVVGMEPTATYWKPLAYFLGSLQKAKEAKAQRLAVLEGTREHRLLLTIPGVGPILASGFLAEIGRARHYELLLRQEAPVDDQLCAGDVRRLIRSQVQHGLRYFVRGAHARHRRTRPVVVKVTVGEHLCYPRRQ